MSASILLQRPILGDLRRRVANRRIVWTLAIAELSLVLYAVSPHRDSFPATVAGILVFAVGTTVTRSTWFRTVRPMCPLNWFLLLFFIVLVVDPLILCFLGPYVNTLPELPGDGAINIAELIDVIAFAAFVAGCEISQRRADARRPKTGTRWTLAPPTTWPVVAICVVLGVIGVGLAFHSPHALEAYYRHSEDQATLDGQATGGVRTTVSLVLRAFLQFAVIIPWCAWLDRRRPRGWRLWIVTVLVGLSVALAESSFSYNRGSIAAPLVAVLAALGWRRARLRIWVLVAISVVAFAVFAVERTYRNASYSPVQALTSSKARSDLLHNTNLDREIQIYANAPQYLGFFLQRKNYGANPKYGLTVLSSVLSPIPRLGIPFRKTSGPTIFNHTIYGQQSTDKDQNIPFSGELFNDFAYAGVFLGFALLGALAARLQRLFERSRDALRAFTVQYATFWISFLVIGSISDTTQVFIYFFWPAVLLLLLAWRRRRRDPPAVVS